jgi:prephenate dehydrogenase
MRKEMEETIAAVRGAITVADNEAGSILDATRRLLETLLSLNGVGPERIVSALFTSTPDLDADFPAHAARRLGWSDVPMLCAKEIPVPGALERVVRVMLTVRIAGPNRRLRPVYLDGAAALRPDLAHAMPPDRPGRSVAIVGLGQIGGSIGLALGDGSWRRSGFDLDPETVARAFRAGAIDAPEETVAAACRDADLVIVAVPVEAIPGVVRDAAKHMRRRAVLLDTGSARAPLTPVLIEAQASGVTAVGGHPLAGNEGHGFSAARADLFQGATFALMPIDPEIPPIVDAFVEAIGARAKRTEPAEHDRALARTSHLPYVLSCALRATCAAAVREDLYGPGYQGMARLAASDPAMAEAFCRANASELESAWRTFRADMDRRVGGFAGGVA